MKTKTDQEVAEETAGEKYPPEATGDDFNLDQLYYRGESIELSPDRDKIIFNSDNKACALAFNELCEMEKDK